MMGSVTEQRGVNLGMRAVFYREAFDQYGVDVSHLSDQRLIQAVDAITTLGAVGVQDIARFCADIRRKLEAIP